jgi:YVTN family beta-propeller protein
MRGMRRQGEGWVWLLGCLALAFLGGPPAHLQPQRPLRAYVSNEYGASITVIDVASDRVIGTIPVSGRPGEVRPRGMAVSPDGRRIYVALSDFNPQLESNEDKVVAVEVESNKVVAEYRVGSNPERVALSPDGTQLWAANENAARATAFDLRTGKILGEFQTGVEPEGVAVSPDGRFVYVTSETSHTVTVIDTKALKLVKHFLVGHRPRFVVFARDGSKAYVSAEIGGTVSVVDAREQRVVQTISLGLDSRPVEMVLSPDGRRLFVAGGGTSATFCSRPRCTNCKKS